MAKKERFRFTTGHVPGRNNKPRLNRTQYGMGMSGGRAKGVSHVNADQTMGWKDWRRKWKELTDPKPRFARGGRVQRYHEGGKFHNWMHNVLPHKSWFKKNEQKGIGPGISPGGMGGGHDVQWQGLCCMMGWNCCHDSGPLPTFHTGGSTGMGKWHDRAHKWKRTGHYARRGGGRNGGYGSIGVNQKPISIVPGAPGSKPWPGSIGHGMGGHGGNTMTPIQFMTMLGVSLPGGNQDLIMGDGWAKACCFLSSFIPGASGKCCDKVGSTRDVSPHPPAWTASTLFSHLGVNYPGGNNDLVFGDGWAKACCFLSSFIPGASGRCCDKVGSTN